MKPSKTLVTTAALLIGTSGCFLFDSAGTEEDLGELHIEAQLVADTCGPGAFPEGPSMAYDVDLRRQGDTLYWVGPSGTVLGRFSSDRDFCIQLDDQWHVRDADPWYDDPGCDLRRIERLCGTLDFAQETDETGAVSERVTSLVGRHEAFVSGTETSDCSDQVGVSEGQYLTLPCQITYELQGAPVEP